MKPSANSSPSLRFLFLLLALLCVTARGAFAADLRGTANFNRDWKFELGDVSGAEAPAFDDSGWDGANLPHSFSMPYFAATDKFYVGYGWYRKHLDVSEKWIGNRISLEFDGVFQVAEIFVNGRRVGEHKGGYTGFTVDITDAVKPGDNVVAIRVNNLWNARLAPRAGEHAFSGGIYRNVRLVMTAPLHVAWYGTFVTTPQVSKASGIVNVKTEVVNESKQAKSAMVRTDILDADGKTVASMQSTQTVAAGATAVFDQTSRPVSNPKLWHPDHPNLYTARTTVLDGGKPVDDFVSSFGFRWFKFTADKGFFLNDEHYFFKGANVHQDHAGWGDAVADSGFFRDVKMVKEAGMDFIRGSHYPHAPSFAQACDEIGVLFWSENCFWGIGGFQPDGYWNCSAYPVNAADEPEFEASVKASLRDMIRINRNHPSIIVWSMSNEPFFSENRVMPKVKDFLGRLVAYSHEQDPTRPAGIGGCQRPLDAGRIDKVGDVAGYNGGGGEGEFQKPGVPSVVTEYGSTITLTRPGKYEAGWDNLAKAAPEWRSGYSLWCAFDHGSIAGQRFGAMGMIDYYRLPKRIWYWYRNEYRHIPPPQWPANGTPAKLGLSADKRVLKSADGTDDAQIVVTVLDSSGKPISNSPPVTLTIESGPGEFPTGPSITFNAGSDIIIADGMAAIEFRSYYAGKTVIRATSPGLSDAVIGITTLGGPQFIPGTTPPVQSRPYVRFSNEQRRAQTITLGRLNPLRASSEAPERSGRMANDGDPATYWQSASGDRNAWIRVDLEKIVAVRQTKLTFPTPGNWRYKVELSEDGETNWKMLADQTQTTATGKERVDMIKNASDRGRFLRVTVTGAPAGQSPGLAELEAQGVQ